MWECASDWVAKKKPDAKHPMWRVPAEIPTSLMEINRAAESDEDDEKSDEEKEEEDEDSKGKEEEDASEAPKKRGKMNLPISPFLTFSISESAAKSWCSIESREERWASCSKTTRKHLLFEYALGAS